MKKLILLLCTFALCFTLVSCNEYEEISYKDHVIEAVSYIKDSYTHEELQLPNDFTTYTIVSNDDYMYILDNKKTISISVYTNLDETMELMGIYYYDVITKDVYMTDYLTGNFILVEHNDEELDRM